MSERTTTAAERAAKEMVRRAREELMEHAFECGRLVAVDVLPTWWAELAPLTRDERTLVRAKLMETFRTRRRS